MCRWEAAGTTAVAAVALGATVAWLRRPDWGPAWTTQFAMALLPVSIWLLVAATLVLVGWRPAGRMWILMAALSLAWSWSVLAMMTPLRDWGLLSSRGLTRPSMYLLLLAWPSGHLRSADRIWWATYSILQAVLLWFLPQFFLRAQPSGLPKANGMPAIVEIAHSFGLAIVLPVGGVLLYVSVRRHAEGLPPTGRRLQRPIVLAAAVAMILELAGVAAIASESGFDEFGHPEVFGGLVLVARYLPYATTPVLAVLAVLAVQRARVPAHSSTSIEIGPAESVLRNSLIAVDRDDLDVRFAGPGGSWLDREGRPVPPPNAGRVVEIRRDDEVIATVSAGGRGSTVSSDGVERAIAAAGASADFARLAATANATRRNAANARRAMSDARDAAFARLERDLHDGAQQQLVGLALQAAMANRFARDDDNVARDLRTGVTAARQQIAEAASGLFPAIVDSRGLESLIAHLGACTAMRMEIDVDLPADIPAVIAAGAWFIAAESVANASKHADADRLRVVAWVVDSNGGGGRRLELVIDDDGRGGADLNGSGFVGLRSRVERFGGDLDVSSPIGEGTVVRASIPLPTTGGAL